MLEANTSSTWALEYAPVSSQNFRLWNTAANCYLSTSYRSFPDWDRVYANDTVLRTLNLELETTCLNDATASASTWQIVDGELFTFDHFQCGFAELMIRIPRIRDSASH